MRFLFLLLPLASFALRLLSLAQTAFANGWDAYFYLVQIKSLEETGRMHSPEASLIYPFLLGLFRLTADYILAYKLGAALLAGGFTAAMMGAGYQVAGARAAILLGAWTLCSGHLTYFAAQYPKNLLGMSLLVLFVAALAGTRPRWMWAAALLILGYFGHRFTFGLSVVFGGLWLLFRYGGKPMSYLSNWKTGVAAGILLILLLLAAVLFPGLLHWSDWQRLSGHVSARPQWPPWSFYTSFGTERVGYWWRIEIVSACLIWLWTWATAAQKIRKFLRVPRPVKSPLNNTTAAGAAFLLLTTLLLFPFLEWSLTGLSYRAFLVFILLFPLLLVVNVGPLRGLIEGVGVLCATNVGPLRGLRSMAMRFLRLQSPPSPPSPPVSSSLLLLLLLLPPTYRPSLHDPNYALYRSVTRNALVRLENKVRPELVIAPNALAEFFTFHTGIDAMPWLPEYEMAPERLWRIAAGVREPAVRYYTPGDSLGPLYLLPDRYLLLQERRWQSAIRAATAAGDTAFVHACRAWPNPSVMRPGFLLRRKNR